MNRWLPSREQLMRSRWLAPLGRHLEDERLWHFERGSVARAVAIGVFFGFMLPVAQFLFAVGTAIWLRGHVAVAAGATLVTNPLTFAPVYWLAHRIGSALLGRDAEKAEQEAQAVEAKTEVAAATQGWLHDAWEVIAGAGAPLVVGLAVLAVSGAALGFTLVWLLWRPRPASGGSEDRTR